MGIERWRLRESASLKCLLKMELSLPYSGVDTSNTILSGTCCARALISSDAPSVTFKLFLMEHWKEHKIIEINIFCIEYWISFISVQVTGKFRRKWELFPRLYVSSHVHYTSCHYSLNPNPRARKAYLRRNRVSNNVVVTPGFDPRTSRTPAPWSGRPRSRCSCDDAIALDAFSQ